MELRELIQEFKNKTGYSDSEIARRCGVSRSTVMRWSKGEIHRLSSETMERMSELFGYNIEPVLKNTEPAFRLPILGYVKAGYDLFAEENWLGEEEVTVRERKDADYYLKVTGDSMIGCGIMDGSLVLVRKTSVVLDGEIAVVLVGEEVTVKKVHYRDSMFILEAANPTVPSRFYTEKEVHDLPVQIIGKVLSCKTYY